MKNAIHMLRSATGTQMNSFLITTASGKIIAIDGGFRADAPYFLNYLKSVVGSLSSPAKEMPKTGSGHCPPHIDAWFLTHPHDDHVDAFFEIMEHHADEVTVGAVYLNFPSESFVAKEDASAAGTMRDFYRALPRFADRVRICSGGDSLDVGEAHFDILYSHDFEVNRNVANNASLVFRMELGGKSVMFTGDCGVEAGQKILRLWKDSGLLKCDVCQMAHHGQNGCDRDFYEAVSPEECLWCTPQWLWDNDAGKGYDTHVWKTIVVRGWMDEIGVKRNYVIKDGTQVCVL